jgi:hypothetical protein
MWFVVQNDKVRRVYEATVHFFDYKRRTRREIMLGLLQGCIESNPGEKIYCVHNSEVSLFKVHIERKVNGAEEIMSNFNDIVKLLPNSTYYALRPKRARATMVATSKKAFKFSYDGVFREYTPMVGIPLQVEFQVSYPIKISIQFDGPGEVCLHTSVQMIDEMRVGREFVAESGPLRIVSRVLGDKSDIKGFIRRNPSGFVPNGKKNIASFEKNAEIKKFMFNQHLDVIRGKAQPVQGQKVMYFGQTGGIGSTGRGRRGRNQQRNGQNGNVKGPVMGQIQKSQPVKVGISPKSTLVQSPVTVSKRKIINGLSIKILDFLKVPGTDQQISDLLSDYVGLGTKNSVKGALWVNEQVRNLRDRKVSPLVVLKEAYAPKEIAF